MPMRRGLLPHKDTAFQVHQYHMPKETLPIVPASVMLDGDYKQSSDGKSNNGRLNRKPVVKPKLSPAEQALRTAKAIANIDCFGKFEPTYKDTPLKQSRPHPIPLWFDVSVPLPTGEIEHLERKIKRKWMRQFGISEVDDKGRALDRSLARTAIDFEMTDEMLYTMVDLFDKYWFQGELYASLENQSTELHVGMGKISFPGKIMAWTYVHGDVAVITCHPGMNQYLIFPQEPEERNGKVMRD
ncbi:MAG TPA: hypothetical protein VM260_10950, partial [Pirellula sp.]|nr:hypothetical protein [Pirellula sp.]